jgi:steroid delta-isomerase-like uncharacterized protein
MSTEANKALVRRFIDAVINGGQLDVTEQLLAPGFAAHITGFPELDATAWRETFRGFRAAFSDLRSTIEDLVAEGDRVAMRATAEATHRGELMGIPATGKRVQWVDFSIFRIADGKLAEEWMQMDMAGLMQQLAGSATPAGRPA